MFPPSPTVAQRLTAQPVRHAAALCVGAAAACGAKYIAAFFLIGWILVGGQ